MTIRLGVIYRRSLGAAGRQSAHVICNYSKEISPRVIQFAWNCTLSHFCCVRVTMLQRQLDKLILERPFRAAGLCKWQIDLIALADALDADGWNVLRMVQRN